MHKYTLQLHCFTTKHVLSGSCQHHSKSRFPCPAPLDRDSHTSRIHRQFPLASALDGHMFFELAKMTGSSYSSFESSILDNFPHLEDNIDDINYNN